MGQYGRRDPGRRAGARRPNVRNLGSARGSSCVTGMPGSKKIPPVVNESVTFYADEVDGVRAMAKRDGST